MRYGSRNVFVPHVSIAKPADRLEPIDRRLPDSWAPMPGPDLSVAVHGSGRQILLSPREVNLFDEIGQRAWSLLAAVNAVEFLSDQMLNVFLRLELLAVSAILMLIFLRSPSGMVRYTGGQNAVLVSNRCPDCLRACRFMYIGSRGQRIGHETRW
jgi:hypothetical protein